jgi:SAM-dependent methyltransferase
MPALSHSQTPEAVTQHWYQLPAGVPVLESEQTAVADALAAHPVVGLPWLWLSPVGGGEAPAGRGLRLTGSGVDWEGPIVCRLPLPLASESLGAIVLQHLPLATDDARSRLLDECARLLVPGGRLAVFALNPLSPYRLRLRRGRPSMEDPGTWRRHMADAGLSPESSAQGIGPQWSPAASPSLQSGPGLRAAYLQRAEKRAHPITPVRQRKPLGLADGVPAT